MKLEEYSRYDATDLADLIRSRQISAKEAALAALGAVEKLNPHLNAITDLYHDHIESLNQEVLGQGPFRGVPFLTKAAGGGEAGRPMDNYGSQLMRGAPLAKYDIEIISRFKKAGLNIIGRTIVPELGATITVESPCQGITLNPWNANRVAGGSSTGAGVAVAAGIVPIAHANDSGGSTRVPASCNGVVGLKCSRGRVSLGPDGSDIAYPTPSQFVITRTVRDSAALLDAVEGTGPADGYIAHASHPLFLDEIQRPIGRLRIAVAHCEWGGETHPKVIEAIDILAKKLEGLGQIVEVDSPKIDFIQYRRCFLTLYFVGISQGLTALSQMMGREINEESVQPMTLKLYEKSQEIGLKAYFNALQFMNQATRILANFFQSYDLLLTPALGQPVPSLEYLSLQNTLLTAEEFCSRLFGCSQYLQLANFTGVPAISLPVCRTPDGMPLGAQFIAPMGKENILLRLAATLEQAIPWSNHLPPCHVSNS